METLSILLYASLLIFSTIPTLASAGEKCHPTDKKVLFKIKEALHNPYHLASWTHDTDCCTWYCVKCNPKNNRIFSLIINNGEVNGEIPDAVGDLPYLETLWFRKLTNLTGTIPPAIAKLTLLKDLVLSWTHLSGPVPSFLSRLKNLETLELSYNRLTGSIPPSLSLLPRLSGLYLDRNGLTGPIPDTLRLRGSHPYLFLSKNQLSGNIPPGLARTDFSAIKLFRNNLQGDASFLLGKNRSTHTIDLSRNRLSFDLSKVREFPPQLIALDLSHNMIVGGLSAGLTKLPELQLFNVSYNRLCGKIPVGGEMGRFDEYSYLNNKCLCGAPLGSCKK